MTLYVYVANGNIRSKTETVLTEGAICGYVKEGDTLAATGESKEWYRVLYNEKTCYVRKSIVCDNALIDAFRRTSATRSNLAGTLTSAPCPKPSRAVPTT